jgi:putative SOS response-associated peptidase YedK
MCGRFALISDLSLITEAFNIQEIACDYRTSINILPGHTIAAVIHDGVNRLVQFRWGLIPYWAKDPSIGSRLINARAETLSDHRRRFLRIVERGKEKDPHLFPP